MDHNAQGRRPHFHRGRRGSDRRGSDRRAPQQASEQSSRSGGDHVDVEQIMRDIRARIAQRSGVELSTPQIQELAARRLEAILDPRTISPALTEQLRRGASTSAHVPLPAIEGGYVFEDTTLYETHRGLLRFIRRLLHPILKLLFNPNPLIQALNTQAKLNTEAAARERERERRQAEWNALHYEILNRLVTEVSRAAVDVQALSMRMESLAARVDFTDKRVRTIESGAPPPRQHPPRAADTPLPAAAQAQAPSSSEPVTTVAASPETPAGEGGARRKRRRRRGRRSGGGMPEGPPSPGAAAIPAGNGADVDGPDADEPDDDEAGDSLPVIPEPEPTPILASPAPQPPPEPEPPPVSAQTDAPPADVPPAAEPAQPTPPPDEPVPAAPVDHPDPGPPDR